MNLAEALARAELDALPVTWDGPLYSMFDAMARDGTLALNPDATIDVHAHVHLGDGSWYFWSPSADVSASGSSAREAFERLLASLA